MATQWSRFVTFVNVFYALDEARDSAVRIMREPPDGLAAFCHDANPFLWDQEASADPAVYHSFCDAFEAQFGGETSSAEDGYLLARAWLREAEGQKYGDSLVSSFDSIVTPSVFAEAYPTISQQLDHRKMMNEFARQGEEVVPGASSSQDTQIVPAAQPDGTPAQDEKSGRHATEDRLSADELETAALFVSSAEPQLKADWLAFVTRGQALGNVAAFAVRDSSDCLAGVATVTFVEAAPTEDNPSGVVALSSVVAFGDDAKRRLGALVAREAASRGVTAIA